MNTDMAATRRRRGRPKSKVTRDAVIAVARELFLEIGPDVPIEVIATQARISKPLLYRQFRDKDDLMEAVLQREADRAISQQQASKYAAMEFSDALLAFGMRYLSFVNDQLRGWGHLIVSMLPRHPDLARRFFEKGPARDHACLIALIATGVAKNILVVDNPAEAAGDLLGSWLGIPGLEINLRARDRMSQDEIATRVERGVARFMQFHGTQDQSQN